MLEKLTDAAERRGAAAVARQIDRLANTPVPSGTTVKATKDGVAIIGKKLRRRMLADPQLRNFGR